MAYNSWTKDNPNCLSIKWENSIYLKSSILWRGIIFHVKLEASSQHFGSKRTITFRYASKEYICEYWRWKQYGGCTDRLQPVIKTFHNELKITMDLKSVSFEDIQLDNNLLSQPQGELFKVTIPPANIFPDLPAK